MCCIFHCQLLKINVKIQFSFSHLPFLLILHFTHNITVWLEFILSCFVLFWSHFAFTKKSINYFIHINGCTNKLTSFYATIVASVGSVTAVTRTRSNSRHGTLAGKKNILWRIECRQKNCHQYIRAATNSLFVCV